MKFNGTIIITDPCYIIIDKQIPKDLIYPNIKEYLSCNNEEDYPDYKDSASVIYCQELHNYLDAVHSYHEEADKYDDWKKCDYGEYMERLGITHYINENTIYGDWSCTTYEVDKDPVEIIESICEDYRNTEESTKLRELKNIGEFCADTGQVAVFLLNEVLAYNPDFEEWMKKHDWCVTIIKDFKGDVEYYVDSLDEAHIIGKGNINFMTTQTGLWK